MATPNETEEDRVAHVAIFFDSGATYNGARHIVTDPLGLTIGERFEHEMFPDWGLLPAALLLDGAFHN